MTFPSCFYIDEPTGRNLTHTIILPPFSHVEDGWWGSPTPFYPFQPYPAWFEGLFAYPMGLVGSEPSRQSIYLYSCLLMTIRLGLNGAPATKVMWRRQLSLLKLAPGISWCPAPVNWNPGGHQSHRKQAG